MFRVNYPNKIFDSKGLNQVAQACARAVNHQGSITAIIGEVGVGKTVAVYDALGRIESKGVYVVWTKQPEKERLRIGGIMAAMIRFFGEDPRRDMEARTEQLRRLLGMKSKDHRIVLVIDEAHALHRNTMRALKRLLELGFGRRMGLFSIVMICQPEIYGKLRTVPEIALRTRKVEMKRLTDAEAKGFVTWVAGWEGVKVETQAQEIIGQRLHNPLRIASLVALMAEWCESLGETKITKAMCHRVWANDMKSQMERYGISQKDIAERLGKSKTTVNMALQGKYRGKIDAERLNEALSSLVAERVR